MNRSSISLWINITHSRVCLIGPSKKAREGRKKIFLKIMRDFSGIPVVKNPPANAGNMVQSLEWELRSNKS